MYLDAGQMARYIEDGYLVVACPWPAEMTERLRKAVEQVAAPPHARDDSARSTQFRLLPQEGTGSGCNVLDQCLEFLQVMLHPEVLELSRQLEGTTDIYFRNGGINELRPGKSILWHHDYKNDGHCEQTVSSAGVEFMHYFGGSSRANGCLRLVPASHSSVRRRFGDGSHSNQSGNPRVHTPYEEVLEGCRCNAGMMDASSWNDSPGNDDHPNDVALPGEVSLELRSDQLLIRSTSIFHSTHMNHTDEGRLMHHWLLRLS